MTVDREKARAHAMKCLGWWPWVFAGEMSDPEAFRASEWRLMKDLRDLIDFVLDLCNEQAAEEAGG